jgi:hypothetical protein
VNQGWDELTPGRETSYVTIPFEVAIPLLVPSTVDEETQDHEQQQSVQQPLERKDRREASPPPAPSGTIGRLPLFPVLLFIAH